MKLLEADSQFDVVITDYAMPGMTGLDLATKIKKLRPKLPIIIATGFAELPPDKTLGFPRLNKPYTNNSLPMRCRARRVSCPPYNSNGVVEAMPLLTPDTQPP